MYIPCAPDGKQFLKTVYSSSFISLLAVALKQMLARINCKIFCTLFSSCVDFSNALKTRTRCVPHQLSVHANHGHGFLLLRSEAESYTNSSSEKMTETSQILAGQNENNPEPAESTLINNDKLPNPVQQMSKRAQKRLLKKEKLKALRKAKREPHFTTNPNPGFDKEIFAETDYYFENGLRKVYPYPYTFSTYAKERWFGLSLQDVFQNEFRVDSPDNIKTSIAKGNLRVNGQVVDMGYTLKNGDLIEHLIHRHENPVIGEPIEIIEDTPDLVVINKPSSIPCHPCGKFRFNSIVFIMGKEFGYANLRNIYRLDRLTSGVLIMGKTARKTKELETQVLKRHVHKEYVARVVGEFPKEELEVNQPLDCLSHKLTLWQVRKGGKPSRTTFQRISFNGKTSLVRCIPHTGRTHQIRVHLQYLGHPIVNDPYYNSSAWGPQRGKGGHSELTFEEICKRIMQEHNVGMWMEGENPLFNERLVAVEPDDPTFPHSDICVGTAEGESECVQTRDSDSPLSSPKQKKRRLFVESKKSCQDPSPGAPSLGAEGEGSTGFDVVLQSNIADACEEQKIQGFGDIKPNEDVIALPESVVSSSVTVENNQTLSSEEVGHCSEIAENRTKKLVLEQRGFEPQKWVPDLNCQSCRLKYVDPKPTDLLIYLHAYKYKGPTWEYTAKMPHWVADDWEEPPEYSHFLS